MTRRTALFGLSVVLLPRAVWAQVSPSESNGSLVAAFRRLRTESEEAAALVKARFADTSTQYIGARRHYGVARAAVEEVVGLLRQAILNGNEIEIEKSTNLRRAASEARDACTELLEYVDRAIGNPAKRSVTAVVAVLGSIVAVAFEILKVVSASADLAKNVEERRQKRASQLEAELVWMPWSQLPGRK